MRKFGWIGAIAMLAACTQESSTVEKKLDAITARLASIEQKIGAGGVAKGGAQQQPQRPKRPEPDKDSVFAVPIAGLPFRGSAAAPVTIVEGYEYACPACNMARETVAKTLEKYGDKIRVVYKPYIVHPDIATDAYAVAFGDFRRGYLIVDRLGVRILRDPYSAKPYVLFYTTKRVGGGVQDFDAIKLLKFAAS